MYQLVQARGNTYYLDCPAKIGLYRDGKNAWLIDCGGGRDAAKKALDAVESLSMTLCGIIATHCHTDHTGGAAFLYRRTGAPAYARGADCAFIRHALLEPSMLWGACPPKALRNRALMGNDCPCLDISDAPLPAGMEILDLPGHSFDMIGVRTPDDVVFLADVVSGADILEKYHITYQYDIETHLQTLTRVERLRAALFIPAHGPVGGDIAPLCAINRAKIHEIRDMILQLLQTPQTFETLLAQLFDRYALTMTYSQYALTGSTVRSYLAYLSDAGKITYEIRQNLLLWQTRED